MKKQMVKCNKADKCPTPCAAHGLPHERENILGKYCTSWGLCNIGTIEKNKVRCVKIKNIK